MPTHLYCLLPPGSEATAPSPARAIDLGFAIAWVGDTGGATLSRDARDAARATIEHDRVIGAALADGVTPVPAALSDPYASDADLKADLSPHAESIAAAFSPVAGMAEMTTIVAVVGDAPPSGTAGRGRAYLELLRDAPARARAAADDVLRVLPPIEDVRRRENGPLVATSHLVSRDFCRAYRELLEGVTRPGLRVVVDGPRAPYSFVRYSPRHGLVTGMWLGRTGLQAPHRGPDELNHG